MDDAKALGKVLSKYKDTFYVQVLVAYFATYVLYPFLADVKNCELMGFSSERFKRFVKIYLVLKG